MASGKYQEGDGVGLFRDVIVKSSQIDAVNPIKTSDDTGIRTGHFANSATTVCSVRRHWDDALCCLRSEAHACYSRSRCEQGQSVPRCEST